SWAGIQPPDPRRSGVVPRNRSIHVGPEKFRAATPSLWTNEDERAEASTATRTGYAAFSRKSDRELSRFDRGSRRGGAAELATRTALRHAPGNTQLDDATLQLRAFRS